jgi:hypothetical protein
MNIDKIDSKSAVYHASDIKATERIQVPQKAKSRFYEEECGADVAWGDLRAEMKEVGGETYVIVGECP